jgi:hypothetical protein
LAFHHISRARAVISFLLKNVKLANREDDGTQLASQFIITLSSAHLFELDRQQLSNWRMNAKTNNNNTCWTRIAAACVFYPL